MKIKKQKTQNILHSKLKFREIKNCLEANQFENELNFLEKVDIEVDSLTGNHKKFIKSNRIILRRR